MMEPKYEFETRTLYLLMFLCRELLKPNFMHECHTVINIINQQNIFFEITTTPNINEEKA